MRRPGRDRAPDLKLPFPQVGFDLLKAELDTPAVHLQRHYFGALRPGDEAHLSMISDAASILVARWTKASRVPPSGSVSAV